MVFSMQNGVMSAPIPGQGLTNPMGASPNQHPPQFVHLDDALNFTWDKMHKPKSLVKLIGILKAGMPVEVIARTIIYQGLLQNRWTVTLGLLMTQTVIWQIEAIAKLKKIKAQTFTEDLSHRKQILDIGNQIGNNNSQDTAVTDAQDSAPESQPDFKGFF